MGVVWWEVAVRRCYLCKKRSEQFEEIGKMVGGMPNGASGDSEREPIVTEKR